MAITYQGSPCKRGHPGIRYVRGKGCVDCHRETAARRQAAKPKHPRVLLSDDEKVRRKRESERRYADRNRETRNRRRRETRANDPAYRERATAYQLAHERRNRDATRARKRDWYRANPDTRTAQRHARRAAQRDALGRHNGRQLRAILNAQGGRCAYCDESRGLHLDHVIPLTRGGSNWPWNLQYLCGAHNTSKGTRTDAEFRALLGLAPAHPVSLQLWAAALAIPLQPASSR